MRVLFVGGGTLGPVTPLLAVMAGVRRLRPGTEFAWIGTKDGPERKVVAEAGLTFHAVSAGKLRRYLSFKNVTDVFRILAGYFQARRLLRRLRPDVVVSAGGFVAVPVVWAAGHLRIPVHVHQQDIRPGLANKLSLRHAASLSVAFEKSLADFPGKRPVWTGNPVRPEVFTGSRDEASRRFGLEAGAPALLVVGGGTGSAAMNDLVIKAMPGIAASAQVIHLTGTGKMTAPAAGRYHPFELLTDDMRHAYAAADLVVTRAGMGVLTELAALGKPAVIMPIPGSHQEENAAFFGKAGAAIVVDERATPPDAFAEAVLGLLADKARLEAMGKAMKSLSQENAAEAVAALVIAAASR